MKRNALLMITILLVLVVRTPVLAQHTDITELPTLFPTLKLSEQYLNRSAINYYRFPRMIKYYDSVGLSYFPHETVSSVFRTYEPENDVLISSYNVAGNDWGMVSRQVDGKTYKQSLLTEDPYSDMIIYGTDMPKQQQLKDFYLYMDMFITESYPEDKGGCYLYYSNSLLTGYETSFGTLIEPRNGVVYSASNNYDLYQNIEIDSDWAYQFIQGTEHHGLFPKVQLDPTVYEGKAGSIGNDLFPAAGLDAKFQADLDFLKTEAETNGFPEPEIYRIELVRKDNLTDLYINGVFVTTIEDHRTMDGVVSWTFGPLLQPGGESVTCAVGNFYMYGQAK